MTKTLKKTGKVSKPKHPPKPLAFVISPEEESRLVYKLLLDIWGFQVESFENFENISKSKNPRTPNVILLEIEFEFNMGLTALSQIKDLFDSGKIPVISISSFPQEQYRSLALSSGADEYMVKPLDYDLLKISLDELRRI